ncbi:hypothetical protein I6F18_18900 [Bradyrhizobium sp. NBAIM32]|uniref:hypothetical protein n=1 Tax=Bradyrhizobium sp. NBAIM32 TaxID=2793809 RepID=UPI001CD33C5C|nr:hypothetical protein [Bradyrhizobium sp. NBAIM32]MCA1542030.1 hypothetical protein [Bradyrhizobium sp. NBAIM32]
MKLKAVGVLIFSVSLVVVSSPWLEALAQNPYPQPTKDGRERIRRVGTCPTGYVGKGNFCEALHGDAPRAYPKVKGAAFPSGSFASGDYCKSFR